MMKVWKEQEYVDDSSLDDEDWKLMKKIMRQITCCEVSDEESNSIRREIIGMAKEARIRGQSLEEVIGESEDVFVKEIFRASTGREMAPGRKQLKGAGIFFIVYGVVYLLHLGGRFLFFGTGHLIEEYQSGGLSDFSQVFFIWGIKEIVVELLILCVGIWTVRHCGDRRRRKKQEIIGSCLLIYFLFLLIETILVVAIGSITVWSALDMVSSLVGIVPLGGIIASGIYISAAGRNKNDRDEE